MHVIASQEECYKFLNNKCQCERESVKLTSILHFITFLFTLPL